MMALFYYDPWFWVTIPGILLAIWAQMRLKSTYGRYSRVGTSRGVTGAQVARHILDSNGLGDVPVRAVEGHLTDHYDPSKRAVFLSAENYHTPSVAAAGVAAHEVGHALQHSKGYAWLGLRMAMVGITGFASSAAWFILFAGMILANMSPRGSLGRMLMFAGVLLFGVTVFFQVITLPVEYDASRRAKVELERLGLVLPAERGGVDAVLSAAALTYVAGMVTAILELLRLFLMFRGSSNDER